jgi:hypothetical protein
MVVHELKFFSKFIIIFFGLDRVGWFLTGFSNSSITELVLQLFFIFQLFCFLLPIDIIEIVS